MAGGIAPVGEVELAYEELGDPDGEPLLLVMGLGMQMIAWDERSVRCSASAATG